MIKTLAAKRLTIYLLFFFAFVLCARAISGREDPWSLLYCLSLLCLNLLASLYLNFHSMKRKPGLFIFHIGLILLILFSGWSRLVYFKGYFEIEEEGIFEGTFLEATQGPIYNRERMRFRVDRGNALSKPDEQQGKEVYGTRLHFIEGGRETGAGFLQVGKTLKHRGYNFFFQPQNHGISLKLIFHSLNTGFKQEVGINLPLSLPRSNSFSLQGSEKVNLTLLLQDYEYKQPKAILPEGLRVLIQFNGADAEVLSGGESVNIGEFKVTLDDIKLWDGIMVSYDPGALYIALAAFLSAFGLLWHFTALNIGSFQIIPKGSLFINSNSTVISLLTGITFLIFWQVCSFGFIWDDSGDIVKNPNYHPASIDSLLNFWKAPFQNLYIPLTYTLWGGMALLSQTLKLTHLNNGLHPGVFHLANLLVHTVNVLLVYKILEIILKEWVHSGAKNRKLEEINLKWASGMGALLWAVHPVQVETVAWINGFRGMLGALFSFSALWVYLKWSLVQKRFSIYLFFSTFFFVLALLSKPSTVCLPLMALIIHIFLRGRVSGPSLYVFFLWGSLSVFFISVTQTAQPQSIMKIVSPFWSRPFIGMDSLAFYLHKLTFPVRLGLDYGRTPERVISSGVVYWTWIIPAALLFVFWFFKKIRPLLFPFTLFVAGVLPVLGFFPFATQGISTVADRYVYLAMIGPALGLAWLLKEMNKNILFLVVLCISVFGIKSSVDKWNWQTEFAVFSHAVKVNPESYIGHHMVGAALLEEGKLEEADLHFSEMRKIKPSFETSPHNGETSQTGKKRSVLLDRSLAVKYNDLGNRLMGIRRVKDAVEKYKKALQIDPDMAPVHSNLSVALHKLKRDDEALHHLRKSLRADPEFIEGYINLGIILGDIGKYKESIEVFEQALGIAPDDAEVHNNLGITLVEKGSLKKGLEHFKKALEIDPNYDDVYQNIEYAKKIRKKVEQTEERG